MSRLSCLGWGLGTNLQSFGQKNGGNFRSLGWEFCPHFANPVAGSPAAAFSAVEGFECGHPLPGAATTTGRPDYFHSKIYRSRPGQTGFVNPQRRASRDVTLDRCFASQRPRNLLHLG